MCLLILLASWTCTSAQERHETRAIVEGARQCNWNHPGRELSCTFEVGQDLEFSIVGLDTEGHQAVVFMRADGLQGDYYGGFSLATNCVGVYPGKAVGFGSIDQPDPAFVSMRTARVFGSWQDCQAEPEGAPLDTTSHRF